MRRYRVPFFALLILANLIACPMPCKAKSSKTTIAQVRIVLLPSRSASQNHKYVKSFKNTATDKDYVASFERINNMDLQGEWYLARQIPQGEYQVRISVGIGKPDIVRLTRIEGRSLTFYFSTDMVHAHIVAVDPLGDIVKDIVVDKVVDEFGTDYAKSFGNASSAIVPSGIYQVQVHAREYGIATGKFCFCQPDSWSVLGIGIPGGDSVYPDASIRLRGNITTSHTANAPIIVRLSPAYMSSSMSAVVMPGSNGKFSLSGALPSAGDYVLLVNQSGHILGSSVLRLPLSKRVSIHLKTGATISLESDRP